MAQITARFTMSEAFSISFVIYNRSRIRGALNHGVQS